MFYLNKSLYRKITKNLNKYMLRIMKLNIIQSTKQMDKSHKHANKIP